jgi:hypothetical protein
MFFIWRHAVTYTVILTPCNGHEPSGLAVQDPVELDNVCIAFRIGSMTGSSEKIWQVCRAEGGRFLPKDPGNQTRSANFLQ